MKMAIPVPVINPLSRYGHRNDLESKKISAILRGEKKLVKPFNLTNSNEIKVGNKALNPEEVVYLEYNNNKVNMIPFIFNYIVVSGVISSKLFEKADRYVGRAYLLSKINEHLDLKNVHEAILYLGANKQKLESIINEKYPELNTICSLYPFEELTEIEIYLDILLLLGEEKVITEFTLNNIYLINDSTYGEISKILRVSDETRDSFLDPILKSIEKRIKLKEILKTDMTSTVSHLLVNKWFNGLVAKHELNMSISDLKVDDYIEGCFKNRGSYLKKYLEGKVTAKELIEHRNKVRKSDNTNELEREMAIIVLEYSKALRDIKKQDNIEKVSRGIIEGLSAIGNSTFSVVDIHLFTFGTDRLYRVMDCYFKKCTSYSAILQDILDVKKSEEGLTKENLRLADTARTSERKAKSLEKKLTKYQYDLEECRETIKKLKAEKSSKKEIDSLSSELSKLKTEIKVLEEEKTQLNKAVLDKSRQYSDTAKLNKQLEFKLRKLEEVFGDIEVVQEDDYGTRNECLDDFDNRVNELNEFKIIICGGTVNIGNYLDKLGLNNYEIIREMGEVKKKKEFDIMVVFTDFVSHKLVYAMNEQAEKQNASRVFYSGTNIKRMLNCVYEMFIGSKNK